MNATAEPLTQVLRLVMAAASHAVIGRTFPAHVDETRAAVTEAFRCALANGLIEIVPPERWPEYVAMTPPYRLPGDLSPTGGGQ